MSVNTEQPINNLEYNLLSVLKNKAEAVQAYDTYIEDARSADSQPCVQLLEKLKQEDAEQVREIRQHLQQVMQNGKM